MTGLPGRRPFHSRADSPSNTYALRRPKFGMSVDAPPTSKRDSCFRDVNSSDSCWDMWELADIDAAFAPRGGVSERQLVLSDGPSPTAGTSLARCEARRFNQ
jgi:hypothetical protein